MVDLSLVFCMFIRGYSSCYEIHFAVGEISMRWSLLESTVGTTTPRPFTARTCRAAGQLKMRFSCRDPQMQRSMAKNSDIYIHTRIYIYTYTYIYIYVSTMIYNDIIIIYNDIIIIMLYNDIITIYKNILLLFLLLLLLLLLVLIIILSFFFFLLLSLLLQSVFFFDYTYLYIVDDKHTIDNIHSDCLNIFIG